MQKNNIHQNTLKRYVDKSRQDEHNQMKPNYGVTAVARSNVAKSGF